ncbi:hypothetical protein [Almyronema epifaneia]|uniref:Uncharacterized protein n=1 Tax=Almyronema epifaneia S1 TaxID=2991925 RepID=A0ABW6ID68_9CYAN
MDFNAKTRLQQAPIYAVSCLEQIQMALAIADQTRLRSLVLSSQPTLMPAHQLGAVTVQIGSPLAPKSIAIDAVLDYEAIECILTETWAAVPKAGGRSPCSRYQTYEAITHYHSDLQTLGENMALSQAIALLSEAGFSAGQVTAILNLPQSAWHKSWWYMLDEMGDFTIPFQRHLRTRCFADGTYTLQYRDYYPQTCPACFKSQRRRVPLLIRVAQTSFWETLKILNYAREILQTSQAIVVCENVSDLELQGYVHQGISVYGSEQLAPNSAINCIRCTHGDCPMCGNPDSPVTACANFQARMP